MTAAVPPAAHGQCPICRSLEDGLGYAPLAKRKLLPADFTFVCNDHIELAKGWHHMPDREKTRIEREALAEAANLTGDYFDRIGKTDLATFTEDEFHTTFAVFLEHYGKAVSQRVSSGTAPF